MTYCFLNCLNLGYAQCALRKQHKHLDAMPLADIGD